MSNLAENVDCGGSEKAKVNWIAKVLVIASLLLIANNGFSQTVFRRTHEWAVQIGGNTYGICEWEILPTNGNRKHSSVIYFGGESFTLPLRLELALAVLFAAPTLVLAVLVSRLKRKSN
jgi:hypothetical protein